MIFIPAMSVIILPAGTGEPADSGRGSRERDGNAGLAPLTRAAAGHGTMNQTRNAALISGDERIGYGSAMMVFLSRSARWMRMAVVRRAFAGKARDWGKTMDGMRQLSSGGRSPGHARRRGNDIGHARPVICG